MTPLETLLQIALLHICHTYSNMQSHELLEKAEVYYNAYQEIRKNSIEWEKVFQKFGREFIEFPEI